MAQSDFPVVKFGLFPRWSLWSGVGEGDSSFGCLSGRADLPWDVVVHVVGLRVGGAIGPQALLLPRVSGGRVKVKYPGHLPAPAYNYPRSVPSGVRGHRHPRA